MAEVTVNQLAEVVGAPVERLLKQMKEAGLMQQNADELVSDEEKQQLLSFLQKSHGDQGGEKKKITLKRKTLSTLRSGTGGRKTVNVEVRKKRTYVKRPVSEMDESESNLGDEQSLEDGSFVFDEAEQKRVVAEEHRRKRLDEENTPRSAEATGAQTVDLSNLDSASLNSTDHGKLASADARQEFQLEDTSADSKKAKKVQLIPDVVSNAADVEAAAQPGNKKIRQKPHVVDDDDEEKPKHKKKGVSVKDKLVRGKSRTIRPTDVYTLDDATDEVVDADGVVTRTKRKSKAIKLAARLKQHTFERPTEKRIYEVKVPVTIQVIELAQRMNVKAPMVIKSLMAMGVMATINQPIDQDTAVLIVEEFGHKPILVSGEEVEENLEDLLKLGDVSLESRAPVVTVMGHVDHGKTSLLDYIRKTKVASGEAGGITQHIGAYHVETERGMISFLDTPGHAAFTAMRARGAKSTDVVILVVAADDGVMPQTEEAIQHARAAGVPIVVAINKIDKESADPDRVKNELVAKGVVPEEWGGDTQFINVSALTGQGIDDLLDAILLQSEMLELKAPRDCRAQGIVIESFLDKGRGPVASVLVQRGTLRAGDIVLAGTYLGRVRAMSDENGRPISEAGPSIPLEILGLDGTPDAGDDFVVVPDEKTARQVADFRAEKSKESRFAIQQKAKLDNLFENLGQGQTRTLNVLVKADVRGSVEAIISSLAEIGNDEVEVNIIYSGVGGITETDVNLAITSSAVMFGFNVRADTAARKLVEDEKVDLRYYSVIYNLLDDVKHALSGMLAPELREEIVGIAEVRDTFKSPKFGLVAGCMVVEGTIYRNNPIRVLRDNVVIFEGELESLRRFKDDAGEVKKGMECGIGVKNYTDVRVGDQIEVFEIKEIQRTL